MKDKKIIVGVTGGIAAYKAAELVRILARAGAHIQVAMTASATKFVAPLTFETVSGNRVVWDMFDRGTAPLDHIQLGQESDLIIVAPATANFIAKMAHGIADDFLSTMVLAATARILVCPSMNSQMFVNPVVQENLKRIAGMGSVIMEPGEGELACQTEGPGRLPEPEDIAEQARMLLSQQDLSGLKVLVTSGATIESIDPVRYITNRSTGKMGYALARAARLRGASVTLVSGPTALEPPYGVQVREIKTAEEMKQAVFDNHTDSDIIIKAAAVSDYRPRNSAQQKIKKGEESLTLDLVRNPDILEELGKAKTDSGYTLVGFAAETEELLKNATEKLRKKNLDIIVANDVSREDAGFESDTNLVKIIYRDGSIEELPLMTKDDVANHLLDRIKELREGGS
ncbi:MAG: bifunctional phosphopantothenoylcysteine decarboxylase/phosphopantothenate--cysteine ligase CoaBC [Deltaproteobacteria bacterium]|nr:bifunctional phosphopantothenoylcysteine decarboxylase/phosphopantothenate--cysteine ligase CoaBC [Deltaproteobacteria bacterium]